MRTTIGVPLLLGVLLVNGASMAGPTPAVATETFVVVRTTSGPMSLQLDLSVEADSRGAVAAVIAARLGPNGVEATDSGALTSAQRNNEGASVGPLTLRVCSLTSCDDRASTEFGPGVTFSANTSRGLTNAFFVVLQGKTTFKRLSGRGWKIHRLAMSFTHRKAADGALVFFAADPYGAVVFQGSEAPGQTHGSLAIARPPCSIAQASIASRGVGSVRLRGGVSEPTFTCPTNVAPITSHSARATQWTLEGTALGDSTLAGSSLLIMNLPRQIPKAAP